MLVHRHRGGGLRGHNEAHGEGVGGGNGLNGTFTYDDKAIVRDDPRIQSWSELPKIFTTHYFGGTLATGTAYRPVDLLSFAANFAMLGFHHGFALSATLPAIVGQQRALELLYTGRRIGGAGAAQIGLADRLAGDDDVREVALSFAREIAASAPLALRSIRQTMRAALISDVEKAVEREAAEQQRLQQTADWREGVRASLERRTPVFRGE